MTDVYLVAARRTAVGSFGGSLKDFEPATLGVLTAKAAIHDAGVQASEIGTVVFGKSSPQPRETHLLDPVEGRCCNDCRRL